MKMKKLTMAVVAASLMGSQLVMAKEGILGEESLNNLAFAFENSSSMKYAPLSHTEMVETEGEAWPAIIAWGINLIRGSSIGAASGAANYTANWGASQWSDNPQSFSQPQFWSSTAGGAIGGPIANRWGTAGNIGGGMAGSTISGYFGNNNYGSNNSSNFGQDFGSYCGACYRP